MAKQHIAMHSVSRNAALAAQASIWKSTRPVDAQYAFAAVSQPPATDTYDPSTTIHRNCPTRLAMLREALSGCCARDDEHAARKRDKVWRHFDPHGSGYISLAACNAGINSLLAQRWGRESHEVFRRFYRSYIRAFADAKDASPARSSARRRARGATRSRRGWRW